MGLKIQCDNCSKVIDVELCKNDLDWQIEDTDEREMGIETHYSAVIPLDCEECQSELVISLDVWEYPEGFLNDQDITVEGGELIDDTDIDLYSLSPIFNEDDYVEE